MNPRLESELIRLRTTHTFEAIAETININKSRVYRFLTNQMDTIKIGEIAALVKYELINLDDPVAYVEPVGEKPIDKKKLLQFAKRFSVHLKLGNTYKLGQDMEQFIKWTKELE